MKFASLLSPVGGWLQRSRCKWLLVMTALCLVLRENYPFSNFPMYSSFNNHTYYLYLTDAQGEALQTRRFGLSSSALKKIFDRQRRKELERFEGAGSARVPMAELAAGQSVLSYLEGLSVRHPEAKKLLPGVQVRHVRVDQEGAGLQFETRTLAQDP